MRSPAARLYVCEACSFDFVRAYGERQNDFIHVHHVVPSHFSGEVESKLDDRIPLCANCHAMVHRPSPWLTSGELEKLVGSRPHIGDIAFSHGPAVLN